MPPKPHRLFLDRVTGYADEASAYMRRRKMLRRPFARVRWAGGESAAFDPETEEGRELFRAAAHLIDVAGPSEATRTTIRTTSRPSPAAKSSSRSRSKK